MICLSDSDSGSLSTDLVAAIKGVHEEISTLPLTLDVFVDGKPTNQIDWRKRIGNLLPDSCRQSFSWDGRGANRVIPFDRSAIAYQSIRSVEVSLYVLADSPLQIPVKSRLPTGKTRAVECRCVLDNGKLGNDLPLLASTPEIALRRSSQRLVWWRGI